ncbi:hypothetical protein MTO96_009816 [Rhipicephalus appendiculatus]
MARPAPPAWPEIRSERQLKPAQEPTPGLVGGCPARSRIIVASAITPPHYAARIPAISPGAPFVDRAARVLSAHAQRPDDRPLSTLLIACNSRPEGRDDRRSPNGGPAALSAPGGITVRVTPTVAAHALRTPRVRPAPIDGQRCVTGQLQAHATVFTPWSCRAANQHDHSEPLQAPHLNNATTLCSSNDLDIHKWRTACPRPRPPCALCSRGGDLEKCLSGAAVGLDYGGNTFSRCSDKSMSPRQDPYTTTRPWLQFELTTMSRHTISCFLCWARRLSEVIW